MSGSVAGLVMTYLSILTATDYLTGALVLITAIYAALTYSIASSNKNLAEKTTEQTEAQTRPIVSVKISIRASVVFVLTIANRGSSVAEHLRLTIDRPFYRFSEKRPDNNIANFHLFTEEITTFAPGEEFNLDLSQGFNLNVDHSGENISPDQFIIAADYRRGSKIYHDAFHIDLRPYFNTSAPPTVAEELEQIRMAIEKHS